MYNSITMEYLEYIKNTKVINTERLLTKPFFAELAQHQHSLGFDNLIEFCYFLKTGETGVCGFSDCDNKTKFVSFKRGYRIGCCEDHTKRLNNLEKYGVQNVMQSNTFKEKFKSSMLEKYGVESALKNPSILDKMKQTQISNGGIGSANSKTSEKVKNTIMEKYGVYNIMQSDTFKNKQHTSMVEKYGVAHALQNTKSKQKRIATNIEKFGNAHHMTSDHKCVVMKKFILDKIEKLREFVIPLFEVDEYTGVEQKLPWVCVTCSTHFTDDLDNGKIPRCPTCDPKLNIGFSKSEQKLVEFIGEKFEIITNTRTLLGGKEIDILIPGKNIAIEFNGVYWHSELCGKDENYHIEKTQQCDQKGIHLIHVFDTEWTQKQNHVKSIILAQLGVFDTRVFAKHTTVGRIDKNIGREFLDTHDLFGVGVGDIFVGLWNGGVLVCVAQFEKTNTDAFSLSRYTQTLSTQVVGGFGKIWKYFNKCFEPTTVVARIDARYWTGKMLEHHGFSKTTTTQPMPYYFKTTSHLIPENLMMRDKSEYFRIWDCGYHVFEWKI